MGAIRVPKSACAICTKSVGPRARAFQCDGCDRWLHVTCAGVSSALYDLIAAEAAPCVKIVCRLCKVVREDTTDSPVAPVVSNSEVPTQPLSAPESTPTTCPRSFAEVATASLIVPAVPVPGPVVTPCVPAPGPHPSVPAHRLRVRRGMQGSPTAPTGTSCEPTPRPSGSPVPKPVKTTPREQCFLAMNLAESGESSSQARLDGDLTKLRDVLASLFLPGEEKIAASVRVLTAFRLGKLREDGTPRPLKVVLASQDQAQQVTQRSSRLRGSQIRILRDLSPEDRIRMKAALEEIHTRRANGEVDLVIRDFRVMRKRPRVRWVPLTIVVPPSSTPIPTLPASDPVILVPTVPPEQSC